MKSKYLLIILVCSALFFILGFFSSRATSKNSEKPVDTVTVATDIEYHSPIAQTSDNSKKNYAEILSGKFVLAGSDYAGYEFIDSKTIAWTNEMFPMDPDTMSLKWIDERTFMTKFTKRIAQNCSPGIGILKVVSYNDGQLVLKDYWTGWNDKKDVESTFHKSYD